MLVKPKYIYILILTIILGLVIYSFWNYETKKRLASINLESLLIFSEDLLKGYSPGEFINPYGIEVNYIQAKNQTILDENGEYAGFIGVYIYSNSHVQIATMYYLFGLMESREGVVPYEISGIGEEVDSVTTKNTLYIRFTRCHALGVLSLELNQLDSFGFENLIDYAKRLDERLKPVVCDSAESGQPE